MHRKIHTALIFLIALLSLALCGCSRQTARQHSGRLNVVSTLDFYGETAQAVLGENGTVTNLIDSPNVDPHDFDPTTKTARQVADADLVIRNGAGYDDWVKKLDRRRTVSVAGIMNVSDGENEHLWYNPDTMARLADRLAAEFAGKMPSKKAEFRKNAEAYKKKIASLNAELAAIRKRKKGRAVAVSEPVFDYSLEKMGFRVVNSHFAKAVEEEGDPSYTDIRDLQRQIRRGSIAFFVYNTQSESPVIKNIRDMCHKHGIPIIKVTETLPEGKDYFSWMRSEYRQISALK